MGITKITLDAEVQEVAIAIQRLREQFAYKKNQLVKALGREPHPEELLSVCDRELEVMSKLHRVLERHDRKTAIPDSLLGYIFLMKIHGSRVSIYRDGVHEQL
jgi:hypothetical protein